MTALGIAAALMLVLLALVIRRIASAPLLASLAISFDGWADRSRGNETNPG